MVDWDELDIRRGIAVILLGLILIGAGIFVLNDYIQAQGLKTQLNEQINTLDNFYSQVKPPTPQELQALRERGDELAKSTELEWLPVNLELDLVKKRIQRDADSSGVTLEEVVEQNKRSEGFVDIYPLKITFNGSQEQVRRFLLALRNLPWANKLTSSPLTFGSKELSIVIDVYTFNQNEWDSSHKCELPIPIPEIAELNIDKIFIFKKGLPELKAEVKKKKAELPEVKKLLDEKCTLEQKVQALEQRLKTIEILKEE